MTEGATPYDSLANGRCRLWLNFFLFFLQLTFFILILFVRTALSHAMSRDGSSGGCVRLAVIDETGVERSFVAGDTLPVLDHQGV